MALSATCQWDVRTGGSDTNGGAFDPGVASPGTDYSQGNSPHISYTDLVIGATNTQLTSVLNPFNSTHVGNCIYITSSTGGFTVGWWEIKSVSGVIATMDRAVGTAASTGGHGNLGGSLATLYAPMFSNTAGFQTGNTVWVQSGTYTVTSVPTFVAIPKPLIYTGYQTTHGDNGTPPLITTATNSVNLFLSFNLSAFMFSNMNFSNTAATPGYGFSNSNATYIFYDCSFSGFSYAVFNVAALVMVRCIVENSRSTGTNSAQIYDFTYLTLIDSVIAGGSSVGVQLNICNYSFIQNCLIYGNAGVGFLVEASSGMAGVLSLRNNTIAGNSSDGFQIFSFSITGSFGSFSMASQVQLENNIFYGNGGYGVNTPATLPYLQPMNNNNAYGGNTLGARNNWPAGANDVALGSTPFTNSSGGDYSLNSGAGLLCEAAGYPGLFPNGTTTGVPDIGAVQTTGGGGRVVGPVPVFETVQATKGVVFSDTLSAVGGTSPYTYAVTSGGLPTGLSLTSGVVSGTPSATGTFSFTITATDTNGYTGSTPFEIVVSAPSAASGGSYTFLA